MNKQPLKMPQNFSNLEQERIVDINVNSADEFHNQTKATETEDEADGGEDRIAKIFVGEVLLITGGTGFLGKVLIEKLLRACCGIKKIYVLIREKKGKSIQERLKEMMNNELFELVKEQRGEETILKQVVAIGGDVMFTDLGLSEQDRKLIAEEVTVIYHCAATIRFDEEFRKAVLLNTRGTKLMLNLAKECKRLKFFAYISTAYCHLHVPHLMEKPYAPPADPEKMIKICEYLDDETVNAMTKHFLGDVPNTYAFTKSLAEDLVVQSFPELPSGILRPSIVIPIWKEPIPGWTDNINGPTGLLIAAGKGVLRSMYCNSSTYGDFLPVDIAVNGMLVATWHALSTPPDKYSNRVGHMTSSNEIQVSWQETIDIGRWIIENRIPLNGVAWYPGGGMTDNLIYHKIRVALFMWLPAILVDCLLWCLRYEPVLCRVQRRLGKGMEVFEYYCNRQWSFDNSECVKFRNILTKKERRKYIIEKIDLDVVKYFENCVLCTRRYILKTPDDMIPAARRHMRVMYVIDRLCKISFCLLFVYFIYCKFIYPYMFTEESTDTIIEEVINV